MRNVEGYVVDLRCEACAGRSSTFIFSGDTDMATAGLVAASSLDSQEIVLGELSADEWRDLPSGPDRFAKRVTADRGTVFKAVPLLRAEQNPLANSAKDFQAFRRAYQPPTLVYGCPKCGGEARVVRTESVTAYSASGGVVHLLGDIGLRG
jgi:hypothetical protein